MHSQDITLGVTQRPPCCRAALAAQVVTSKPNTGLRDFVLTFTSCSAVPELQQLQNLSKQLSSAAGSGIGPYPSMTADCSTHLLSWAWHWERCSWQAFYHCFSDMEQGWIVCLLLSSPAHLRADHRDAVEQRDSDFTAPQSVTEHFVPAQVSPISGSWPCLTWVSHSTPFSLLTWCRQDVLVRPAGSIALVSAPLWELCPDVTAPGPAT